MAKKDKVPVAAIRRIVQMRHDEYQNHTYKMIAEAIKNEFDIEITLQAVGYLYRRNKDKYAENQNLELTNTIQKNVFSKPTFKPKQKQITLSEPNFDKDAEINLTDLFESTE